MIGRRGFLGLIGGAIAAPAIVKADSLMKLWVPPTPRIYMTADMTSALGDFETGWFIRGGATGNIVSQAIGTYTRIGDMIDFAYWTGDQVTGAYVSVDDFRRLTARDGVEV